MNSTGITIASLQHTNATKILGTPSLYIQGAGAIAGLGEICNRYGKKALVIGDETVWNLLEEGINKSLSTEGIAWQPEVCQGQCSHFEIDRLHRKLITADCDHIIGMGGGKVIDTAKGVAIRNPSCPLIIVPTIAASDAATSRICVIYTPLGIFQELLTLPTNPAVILVDSQIIARAPARFILAGMGDAIATKFEADQCALCGARNSFGGHPTQTALQIADNCYRSIRKYGYMAQKDMKKHLVTPAVEIIIEACIYQSGLGFEGGGLSAAHGLTRGFSQIKELKSALHGEQVAFALLVQLVLERRQPDFITEMIGFYRQLGLPCSLPDLGLSAFSKDHLTSISNWSCTPESPIHNMVQAITPTKIEEAIIEIHERYC